MDSALKVLEHILRDQLESAAASAIQSSISKHILYEKDIKDIQISKFEVLVPGFVAMDYAKFSVIISNSHEVGLYLATLALRDRDWVLIAMMKRCPVCKGTQRDVNEQNGLCQYCCATGWGDEDTWRKRFFSFWHG